MEIVVNDANIFIDLLDVGLLESFFELNFEIYTTDFILSEIKSDVACKIDFVLKTGALKLKQFNFDELSDIYLLNGKYSGVSVPDCSCLYLSKEVSGILLTGDSRLRKASKKHKIETHGIIWVLEQMVIQEVIFSNVAVRGFLTKAAFFPTTTFKHLILKHLRGKIDFRIQQCPIYNILNIKTYLISTKLIFSN